MVLIGVKKEGEWLMSGWNLTYPVGWGHICQGAASLFDFYDELEVLVNNRPARVSSKKDILKLSEGGYMTIRGLSKIMKAPMMITFHNQTRNVNVNIAAISDEFKEADYEKFNKSLGQYMDSIELYMYR